MKLLTLMRHAKSSWRDQSIDDYDRGLNRRGTRDGPRMAAALARAVDPPDHMICSGSYRTRATLGFLLALEFVDDDKVEIDDRLYHADSDTIIAVARRAKRRVDHLLLIGHNPGLTDCHNDLTGDDLDNMPTCAVSHLACDIDNWRELAPGRATSRWYMAPKLLPS